MSFRVIIPRICNGSINADKITKVFNTAVEKFKPKETYTASMIFQRSVTGLESDRKIIDNNKSGFGVYIADFDTCSEAFEFKDFMSKNVKNLASDGHCEILQVGTIPQDETDEHRKELGFQEYNCDAV